MEEYTLSEVGKRIKAVRRANNKTQDEVAHAIGVSQMTVSQWETGAKQPGLLNILNFCSFLNLSLDELLDLQKQRSLLIELTPKEREIIFSMIHDCEQEIELSRLPHKVHTLGQYLKAFFGRAYTKLDE